MILFLHVYIPRNQGTYPLTYYAYNDHHSYSPTYLPICNVMQCNAIPHNVVERKMTHTRVIGNFILDDQFFLNIHLPGFDFNPLSFIHTVPSYLTEDRKTSTPLRPFLETKGARFSVPHELSTYLSAQNNYLTSFQNESQVGISLTRRQFPPSDFFPASIASLDRARHTTFTFAFLIYLQEHGFVSRKFRHTLLFPSSFPSSILSSPKPTQH